MILGLWCISRLTQLQQQIVQTYTVLADSLSDSIETPAASAQEIAAAAAIHSSDMLPIIHERKKPVKKKEPPKPVEKPVVIEDDSRPLTLAEQETLTETINELPPEHLHGVIQIIRDATPLTGEEDEIDLEIEELDTSTQRKLLRHVSKVRYLFRGWLIVASSIVWLT